MYLDYPEYICKTNIIWNKDYMTIILNVFVKSNIRHGWIILEIVIKK